LRKGLKRKTTLKSKIPPDLSHEFLLDQQKKKINLQKKMRLQKTKKNISQTVFFLSSCSFRNTNTHGFHGGQAHTGIYKPCQLFIQKHKYA